MTHQQRIDRMAPDEDGPFKECPNCEGFGSKPDLTFWEFIKMLFGYDPTCPVCHGEGEVPMTDEDKAEAVAARREAQWEGER